MLIPLSADIIPICLVGFQAWGRGLQRVAADLGALPDQEGALVGQLVVQDERRCDDDAPVCDALRAGRPRQRLRLNGRAEPDRAARQLSGAALATLAGRLRPGRCRGSIPSVCSSETMFAKTESRPGLLPTTIRALHNTAHVAAVCAAQYTGTWCSHIDFPSLD